VKPPVLWTDTAAEQLTSIALHHARVSPVYATRVVERLLARSEQLEDFPSLGALSRRDQGDGVRELVEGEFILFYLPQATRIDVLAVVHGRQDLPSREL
jgi:plasmid stabilization system protein ParE